jgi:hypothetical protein
VQCHFPLNSPPLTKSNLFGADDQMYLHADLQIKEQALAKTTPVKANPGRYRPGDQPLAFLKSL